MGSALLEQLGSVIREVAEQEIVPRYRKLAPGDVISKPSEGDPGDIVTTADHAAEAALARALVGLVPGSRVVGEEGVAANTRVLARLNDEGPVWLVDPLDGTRNFAAGHGPFGTMVVLARGGELLASGIYMIEDQQMFLAERGAGAFVDGKRLVTAPRAASGALAGTIYARYMTAEQSDALARRAAAHHAVEAPGCAAHEYTRLALGEKDYVVYYRLLPWDHAPGALLLREAGGLCRHPDGRDYDLFDTREPTLLAPDAATWARAHRELFA